MRQSWAHYSNFRRLTAVLMAAVFILQGLVPVGSHAQGVAGLPSPGVMVLPASGPELSSMRGIRVFPKEPLKFEFLVEPGTDPSFRTTINEDAQRFVKYFLTALTVPDKDLWVNLSPYEKDRIVPDALGITDMGRDLLAQDYILKQLTASLMYPERDLGRAFWDRVYAKARDEFGTTDIPVDTFNKVWIIPQKAVVYENDNTAVVVESHLKVMLETDYLAASAVKGAQADKAPQEMSKDVLREIIIPAIEKEVNEGSNFALLRQIYQSMILATWFKRKLKASVLEKVYVGKNKVGGVDIEDKQIKEKIYRQYLEAFKTGAYNYVKDEYDPLTREAIPRKYFSGGTEFKDLAQKIEVVDKASAPSRVRGRS